MNIVGFIIGQWEYSNLPTSNLSFGTSNTKQSSSIAFVNTPTNPINTQLETPNLPQIDINGMEFVRRMTESETFSGNSLKN